METTIKQIEKNVGKQDKQELPYSEDFAWLDNEIEATGANNSGNYEKLPSLKLVENKITNFEIDFSKPFDKWNTINNGKEVTKAIIPVKHEGERKSWWVNLKNPIYKDIIKLGKKGQTKFKIMQTGSQATTRYILVE